MATPDLERRFTYHPPKADQAARYERIRAGGLFLGGVIDELVPDSREKSLALASLEQAVMWANAAIARNE
jgi:hypothetical protein